MLGQLLWLLPNLTKGAVDSGPYCLWGVGYLVFLAAVAGRIVDAADIRSPLPVKVMVAAGLVIAFGATGNDRLRADSGAGPVAAADQGVGDRWYDAMLDRIEAIPGDGPVVLVAASGGGSRAALFAALAYEAMESMPFDPEDPASPTVGSHIIAISSVSGGSLASAWYQHAKKDGNALPRLAKPGEGRWPVLTATMREEAQRLAEKASERFGSSQEASLFSGVRADVERFPATPIAGAEWLDSSLFVHDMGENFMAALLRAVLEPGLSRGESVTRLWVSEFGLGELNNAPGIVPGQAPAVLFNATEVDSGRRFVVGFPRLPPELLGSSMGSMDDPAGSMWVDGAEAARLSANFPWGFDVVSLPGVGGRQAVDLLDGGIVDNTGMDSFARLFEALGHSESPRAQALLEVMRARGVVLVEIDAGARPSETSGMAAMMPGLTRPLRALAAAGEVSAVAARDGNVDRIERVIGQGQAASRFVHLTWVCNRIDNVRTAWSLGNRDQAVTILQFLAENRRLPPLFREAHEALTGDGDAAILQSRIDESGLSVRQFNVGVLSDGALTPEQLATAEKRLLEPVRAAEQAKSKPFFASAPTEGAEAVSGEGDSAEEAGEKASPEERKKKRKKDRKKKLDEAIRKRPAKR